MPWRYSSLDACLDAWAESKGSEDVEQLLEESRHVRDELVKFVVSSG